MHTVNHHTVDLVDHMGSDLTVVNAARVSFDKESEWAVELYDDPTRESYEISKNSARFVLSEKDQKLISYLAKHQHWSPFAHPQIQLRYTVPIFVARQEFKHIVGFVRNEVSRRYVDDAPIFYLPDEWRGRPTGSAKQGSSEQVIEYLEWDEDRMDGYGNSYKHHWKRPIDEMTRELYEKAEWLYNLKIQNGVAPEQARMDLPQSMMTSYYITGSLAAFARFYTLRMDPHAQKEIRDLAELVGPIIEPLYPYSWKVLTNEH